MLVPFVCIYVFAAPSRSHLVLIFLLFWPLSSALLSSPCAHCLSSVPLLTSAACLSCPCELQTPALQGARGISALWSIQAPRRSWRGTRPIGGHRGACRIQPGSGGLTGQADPPSSPTSHQRLGGVPPRVFLFFEKRTFKKWSRLVLLRFLRKLIALYCILQ